MLNGKAHQTRRGRITSMTAFGALIVAAAIFAIWAFISTPPARFFMANAPDLSADVNPEFPIKEFRDRRESVEKQQEFHLGRATCYDWTTFLLNAVTALLTLVISIIAAVTGHTPPPPTTPSQTSETPKRPKSVVAMLLLGIVATALTGFSQWTKSAMEGHHKTALELYDARIKARDNFEKAANPADAQRVVDELQRELIKRAI